MQQLKLIFAVFATFQGLSRIQNLEITLEGFEDEFCVAPKVVKCRSAIHMFNISGKIILGEGEVMPPYILYEFKCPGSQSCYLRPGVGVDSWERYRLVSTNKCDHENVYYGCTFQGGRTYRHFVRMIIFWYYKLCKFRARMIDTDDVDLFTHVNATGIKHVSKELNMSEYSNHDTYSTEFDSWIGLNFRRRECSDSRSANTGVAEKGNLSAALLMTFGSFFTIYMNVFV